jgi:hypothetical protein
MKYDSEQMMEETSDRSMADTTPIPASLVIPHGKIDQDWQSSYRIPRLQNCLPQAISARKGHDESLA